MDSYFDPYPPGVMNKDLPPASLSSYHFVREIRSLLGPPRVGWVGLGCLLFARSKRSSKRSGGARSAPAGRFLAREVSERAAGGGQAFSESEQAKQQVSKIDPRVRSFKLASRSLEGRALFPTPPGPRRDAELFFFLNLKKMNR